MGQYLTMKDLKAAAEMSAAKGHTARATAFDITHKHIAEDYIEDASVLVIPMGVLDDFAREFARHRKGKSGHIGIDKLFEQLIEVAGIDRPARVKRSDLRRWKREIESAMTNLAPAEADTEDTDPHMLALSDMARQIGGLLDGEDGK